MAEMDVLDYDDSFLCNAFLDEEDRAFIDKHKWYYHLGYVARFAGSNSRIIYLHRELMAPEKGMVVDHLNGNRRDNRRCNLQIVTQTQNNQNRGPNQTNKLGIRGVCRVGQRFQATVQHNRKTIYVGTFDTAEEAGIAANNKRKELGFHGH